MSPTVGRVSLHSCRRQLVGEPHCHLPANITAMSSCILCNSSQQREAFSCALRGSVCCYIASPRLSSMSKGHNLLWAKKENTRECYGKYLYSLPLLIDTLMSLPPPTYPLATPHPSSWQEYWQLSHPRLLWELPSAASPNFTAFPGSFPHPMPTQLLNWRGEWKEGEEHNAMELPIGMTETSMTAALEFNSSYLIWQHSLLTGVKWLIPMAHPNKSPACKYQSLSIFCLEPNLWQVHPQTSSFF